MEIEKKPELQVMKPANEPTAPAPAPMAQRIGAEQLQAFTKTLEEYKAGKTKTEQRILASGTGGSYATASRSRTKAMP